MPKVAPTLLTDATATNAPTANGAQSVIWAVAGATGGSIYRGGVLLDTSPSNAVSLGTASCRIGENTVYTLADCYLNRITALPRIAEADRTDWFDWTLSTYGA